MSKQAIFENDFMDVVILSFMGDNSSVCKKICKYKKNIETTEADEDLDLHADKQTLAECVAVAERIKSVTGMSRKKIQVLREKPYHSAEEKEAISILDNANNVCQIMSLINLLELAIKHNDHDMLRYGKERVNGFIEKLYGYQSELLKRYLSKELELLRIPK